MPQYLNPQVLKMKRYLPLIAVLILSPSLLIIPATTSKTKTEAELEIETELRETEIAPEFKEYAKSISVKIDGNSNGGSGVIIGKQNNKYLVITNNHVIRGGNSFTIQTAEGTTHQANIVSNPIISDDDIALLTFSSDNSYQVAKLNGAATGKEEQNILAVGYSAETGKFVLEEGKINHIPNQPFKEGYQIGYTSNIVSGMSGGAILNIFGDLIGINGISAFPILNTAYEYQDVTKQPSPEEIEQLRQLSWGLSLHRLLTQVNPEIITAYNLPLPETVAEIGKTQLTGWLADLETKAQQITVKIDSSSGINGSGIIIAKKGNTYAVLTADHVICEKDKETNDCIGYTYEIVAPDGKTYPLDPRTFKRQEGVDLAVVQFSSTKNYQVAELANYPSIEDDAVFVAGYPKLSNNKPAQWRFSLGYGLDREQGFLYVNDNSLSRDSSGLTSNQYSLAGGYEMLYTSITYGGMSGGAVLDRDGRVIGIHGLAAGEIALDSQSSSATQVQLCHSLGIPINTFIGLADRLEITGLSIQNNRPRELSTAETEAFEGAILSTQIPQGNATAVRWLERGNQLWRLQRHDEAVKAFDKAVVLNPEFIHLAYYGKSLALWYKKESEVALASLEKATETQPNFVPAFFRKSLILSDLNQFFEALVAIDKAISLQQDNANWYNEKGLILFNLKQYSEAEAAYKKAIELSPRAAFYNNRGNLYKNQGKAELALADYNRALDLNPKYADAYNNRGLLYSDQGKMDLALTDYNQAIAINPKDAGAYNNRAIFYAELALTDYNQALSIEKNDVVTIKNIGLIKYEIGAIDEAKQQFEQAIAINGNGESAEPQLALAVTLSTLGDSEKALSMAQEALRIDKQYANVEFLQENLWGDKLIADTEKLLSHPKIQALLAQP